jgi:CheY-like chemotaxis protein
MAKIIVIDDDLAMEILTDGFRFRGHDARRFTNAAEALSNIDEIVSADLVVLDIFVPWPNKEDFKSESPLTVNGMELLLQIRKRKESLPIIVFSAIQDNAVIDALDEDPKTRFVFTVILTVSGLKGKARIRDT